MLDPAQIPAGGFCYRVVRLREGERLSTNLERFGKDLREYAYHAGFKEVLCPYWHRTDYGTVRCDFIGREVMDDDDRNAMSKWAAHFGEVTPESKGVGFSEWLPDEIKICGVREDEDDASSYAAALPDAETPSLTSETACSCRRS